MARIRTIKPEFFRHEELYEGEVATGLPLRIAFAGLWTVADREGRFPWRPRALKLDCMPYDQCDFAAVMDALASRGFVQKYEVDGVLYGMVPGWLKHQVINQREAKSIIPEPSEGVHVQAHASTCKPSHIPNGVNLPGPLRETVIARDGHRCVRCGSTEDLTVDHIFPQSMGGTHAITNLRCLCRSCNSARPVQGEALILDLAKDGLEFSDMQRMCMHVQAHGEGKGREGKGKEGEGDRAARKPAAEAAPTLTIADLISEGVNKDHASAWLAVRAKHRAPLTQVSWEATKNHAAKAGITTAQAVHICAIKSWRGFDSSYSWQGVIDTGHAAPRQARSGDEETPEQKAARREEGRRILFGNKTGDIIDA